jgi:hypothetical protein
LLRRVRFGKLPNKPARIETVMMLRVLSCRAVRVRLVVDGCRPHHMTRQSKTTVMVRKIPTCMRTVCDGTRCGEYCEQAVLRV